METVLEKAKKDNVRFIQLQFTDLLGMPKSITIPAEHLTDLLDYGAWFDGSSIEGYARIAESDMYLKPDTTTYALMPWLSSPQGNTARFICDIFMPDGRAFDGDPRAILKKVTAEAAALGYVFNTGPELEFFLFKKNNGSLSPLPQDHAGYFDLTTDKAYEIRRDMTIALQNFGIIVEASHHEVAIGQHEIDFRYGDALKTADNATTLRFVLKAIAQQHELHATFMPKPIAGINGSGMHVHQSLFDIKTGKNLFYDEKDKYWLSPLAYHFIAGQLHHARSMSAILSPTVNSYKRLVPGYEAPVYVSWARVNRSALIRVPMYFSGKHQSTRVELRCPDPSANIYLAFAVMLKAGLDGIQQKMTPPDPIEEDVYHLDQTKRKAYNITTLPSSLREALDEMAKDPLVKEALGEHTYKRYIEAKKEEWESYSLQVTPWEIDRYLENY